LIKCLIDSLKERMQHVMLKWNKSR